MPCQTHQPRVCALRARLRSSHGANAARHLTMAALLGVLSVPALAQVQATVKPDGQWRYAVGAGGSASRGNSNSTSVNLSGEAVRATDGSKLDITVRGLYTKSEGQTTAENAGATGQYNQDFTPRYFSFGKLDLLRDVPANIESRYSAYGGVGRHMIKNDATTFDLSAGLGYTQDRYIAAALVDNELRTRNGRGEGLLAEESTHKLTPTTSLRQKLTVYPSLQETGDYRAIFDSAIAVSMTQTLSLTAGLTYRYDSNPGAGLVKGDTLFVTGLQFKLD